MPAVAIIIGVMLILVGIGGYGYGAATGHASLTALIPSAIGLIITILGGVATNEKLRKHAMHFAVLMSLIGLLAVGARLLQVLASGNFQAGAAFVVQIVTAILCLAFLLLGVNSFVQARRNRI
jgi:hypothetical protein